MTLSHHGRKANTRCMPSSTHVNHHAYLLSQQRPITAKPYLSECGLISCHLPKPVDSRLHHRALDQLATCSARPQWVRICPAPSPSSHHRHHPGHSGPNLCVSPRLVPPNNNSATPHRRQPSVALPEVVAISTPSSKSCPASTADRLSSTTSSARRYHYYGHEEHQRQQFWGQDLASQIYWEKGDGENGGSVPDAIVGDRYQPTSHTQVGTTLAFTSL